MKASTPILRVGISPCPNDLFIFAGWILGKTPAPGAAFEYEDIETLNGRARDGAYDLVKVSYAHVPQCPDYTPLKCGGALGCGCGPLLLTGGDAFDPNREVLVPGAGTTANFLLDFWWSTRREKAGESSESNPPALRKRFVPFDALYRELQKNPATQAVVIHEMRFTYVRDGLHLIRDLGEHWETETSFPIPLGAVAYRGGADLPGLPEIETAIRDSLAWSEAHEAEALALCALHAQDMDPSVMRAHIELYVNEFSRDLGPDGERAVEFFLSRVRART